MSFQGNAFQSSAFRVIFDPVLPETYWRRHLLFPAPSGVPITSLPTSFTVNFTGIASAEAFGQPSVTADVATQGIATGETVGTPTTTATVSATGIASAGAFGSATITATISLAGIASSEALGQPLTQASVSMTGIASAEALGQPSVQALVSFTGIASAEAIGQPTVQAVAAGVGGIASAEILGSTSTTATVVCNGIASAEAFGLMTVTEGSVASVQFIGIPSAEAFGLMTVTYIPAVHNLVESTAGTGPGKGTKRKPGHFGSRRTEDRGGITVPDVQIPAEGEEDIPPRTPADMPEVPLAASMSESDRAALTEMAKQAAAIKVDKSKRRRTPGPGRRPRLLDELDRRERAKQVQAIEVQVPEELDEFLDDPMVLCQAALLAFELLGAN